VLRTGFTTLAAGSGDVTPTLFDRLVANAAKAFKAIETAWGTPGGLATLDDDGHVPADELGDLVTAAPLHVTGTAAVNTALTVTLPAVGGKFHAIVAIELVKLYSVVGVAAGAGVIVTSTNLPGNPAWTTEQLASAAGTAVKVIDRAFPNPLRAAVAGVVTTLVAPAQLQTIWRWNVSYLLVDA
jgi:hypothetical protein